MHPKNQTSFRSLDRVAADPRVTQVWDEGDDGVWIELADGWVSDCGTSCVHEWSVRDALRAFRSIRSGTVSTVTL